MVYRIGLIGVGGIMNGAHIPGYLTSQRAKITAAAGTTLCIGSSAALALTAAEDETLATLVIRRIG